MTTTLTDTKNPVLLPAARPKPPRENAGVPRHLAVVLNAGGKQRSPSLQETAAVLGMLLNGCAETGVAALTLIHPRGESEIFEAALAGVHDSVDHARESGLKLNLSSAVDGREEILAAVRQVAEAAQKGAIRVEEIDAKKIEAALMTRALPPIDLLISSGSGMRLSGALLWQCAYAELYFLESEWFNFTRAEFDAALKDYAARSRKFGGLA